MRALVSVSDDPTEWFESLEPQSLRLVIRRIRRCVILVPSSAGKKRLRESIINMNENSREIISGLLEEIPMSAEEIKVIVDTEVGIQEEKLNTFDSEEDKIIQIYEQRSELATTVESSSDFFSRTIAVLASAANRVEIYDKYLVSSLMNKRYWALGQLFKFRHLQVSVISEVSKSTKEVWDLNNSHRGEWEERLRNIKEDWERLLGLHRSGKDDQVYTSLELIKANRGALRNRWIIFYFSENQPIALTMPHGLEDFSGKNVKEETQFSIESNPNKVLSITNSWQSSDKSVKIAKFTWRGNKIHNISSKEFPNVISL